MPIKLLTPILPLQIFVVKDGHFCHNDFIVIRMNMRNEYEKKSFIKALIDQLDNQARLPAKVYFNYTSPNFDIDQQKEVLAELKKKTLISSYRWSDDDFIITKPSRTGLFEYWRRLNVEPVPEQKPIDTRILFNEETGEITRGGESCPITINTNQYFLCKALFAVPFGTPVTEIDIMEAADLARREPKRSIRDAKTAVNKKIKTKLGIDEFICWKKQRAWIKK